MAHIQLNRKFWQEVLMIFRERPVWEIIFGKKAKVDYKIWKILEKIGTYKPRQGEFVRLDPIHKARGIVYLIADPDNKSQSLLIFSNDSSITPGPDLWVYLSKSVNPRQELGIFLDLGLLKGTKCAQSYVVNKSINELKDYQSAIIHCKQFSVLFSYALLK